MEFQAYPSLKGNKSVVWRIQNIFHSSDSVVLPCGLLLVASSVVIYEHINTGHDTDVRDFLALLLVSMLPLAFLGMKILSCADPVGALSKFSSKVLLMHAFFLAGHLLDGAVSRNSPYKLGTSLGNFELCMGLGACVLLPTVFGFRPSRKCLYDHLDVVFIVMLACSAALMTEKLSSSRYRRATWSDVLESTNLYMELMAFVPAIWTVCRGAKDTITLKTEDVDDTRKRAVCFFTFVIALHFGVDIYFGAWMNSGLLLAQVGHVIHFLLLLDFAGFLLAHLFDSAKLEKVLGPLMSLFSDSCEV